MFSCEMTEIVAFHNFLFINWRHKTYLQSIFKKQKEAQLNKKRRAAVQPIDAQTVSD